MRFDRRFLVFSALVLSIAARAELTKKEPSVPEEKQVDRRRVTIVQRTKLVGQPLNLSADTRLELARQTKVEQKTDELIAQLEDLIKRPGQKSREGELKMRLADLYFEKSGSIFARESSGWERAVTAWEKKSEADRAKTPRPELVTPETNRFRNQALALYQDLEHQSRGGDLGQSKMIRRDEVLYYLGSTLVDLGKSKVAAPYFEEYLSRYPRGERAFPTRLALAESYFDQGQHAKAIPHYLQLAADQSNDSQKQHLGVYALYKLGWCYQNVGESEKALKAFSKTVERSRLSRQERSLVFEKEALHDLTRLYAITGKYADGDAYFSALGSDGKSLLLEHYRNSADTARDRGDFKTANIYYAKLIGEDANSVAARDLAEEKLQIIKRSGDTKAYAEALKSFAVDYGASSTWLSKQNLSVDEKTLLVQDSVSLIRREVKFFHRNAQLKHQTPLFEQTRPFYEAYFAVVPEPNPDTKENLHEMRFFYGELLFKLKDYEKAARVYGEVGDGPQGAAAAYARILSLQEATTKNPKLAGEYVAATRDFVAKYPQDERGTELMYSSAFEAFQSGKGDEAVGTLREIIAKNPGSDRAVESAKRILFVAEKNKDLDGVLKETQGFRANQELMAHGGADFASELKTIDDRTQFKKIEQMPETNVDAKAAKSQAFLSAASSFSDSGTKEKALFNAVFFAKAAGRDDLRRSGEDQLVTQFPKGDFSKNVTLERADRLIASGEWTAALDAYASYLKNSPADAKNADSRAKAAWNRILIQSYLAGAWEPSFQPKAALPAALTGDIKDYLKTYGPNANRAKALEIVAFGAKTSPADFAALERQPKLNSEEKAILHHAALVRDARTTNVKVLEKLVRQNPPAKDAPRYVKQALGLAAYLSTEPKFAAYQKVKVDYSEKRFVKSLTKKFAELEKLEKDYLKVGVYGDGDSLLLSLDRISKLFLDFSAVIEKAPFTGEVKETLAKQYQEPVVARAKATVSRCLQTASEYRIDGSGLRACQQTARAHFDGLVNFEHEKLPDFIDRPKLADGAPDLLVKSIAAAEKGHFGEFLLGTDVLEKRKLVSRESDRKVIEFYIAWVNWKSGYGLVASKAFAELSNLSGSELAAVRDSAMKAVAAIDLRVGDVDAAQSILSGMSDSDQRVLELSAFAKLLKSQNKEALALYEKLLSKPSSSNALFNGALAASRAGDKSKAIGWMSRYIDLESPAAQDISRVLLRQWKEGSK